MTHVSPPPDLSAPAVPDHDVLRRIGRGAYGEIWLARARGTGAWRAVKVVYRRNFDGERTFRREFEGLAAFEPISRSHDGFVDILQVGRGGEAEGDGFLYYVMELADDLGPAPGGFDPKTYRPRSLRAELGATSGGRLPAAACIELGLRLGEALGALHAHGLSHRDLKPDNVIFVNGRPMLADIGLVAAHGQRSFVGTEGYVPPEGPGGAAADVYGLGKVLYESAMGRDRLDFPALPSRLGEDAAERRQLLGLNAVLLRACAPRVGDRYGGAAEWCADLRRLQTTGRGPRRRWSAGWLFIMGGLVAAGSLAAWLNRAGVSRATPPAPSPAVAVGTPEPSAPTVAPSVAPTPVPTPPPTGRLRIETAPAGALVLLGERELGATPLTVPDLPPGPVAFTVALPGHRRVSREVTVTAGETETVHIALEPGSWPVAGTVWENGLGMRFVPLAPCGAVLMSVWETRVGDFTAFVEATGYDAEAGGMTTTEPGENAPRPGIHWRAPGFPQTDRHPVVGVSWKDAYAFCDWLTQHEHEAGRLDDGQFYRLPTDSEWSRAVGLPPDESGATPQARSGKVRGVFPWGTQWPPPAGAGNYAGTELRAPGTDLWPIGWKTLPGTGDGFPRTAPVGGFPPNALGLHDLGGNAWEWCEDRFAPGGETRVLRGGAWANVDPELLLSSRRIEAFPHARSDLCGFRVVLETPAFGRVELTSEPAGAEVFQAGRSLGRTPLVLPRVPAGEAVYELRLAGHQPVPTSGRVTSGGRLTLHAPLSPVGGPQSEQAWENGLGMRFVPVGERLLFSVWETRVADFAAFCRDTGRAHPATEFEPGPAYPVVNVNREDANAFCAWLTARETAAGRLAGGQRYRLPTDREWSLAAGLPDEPGDTPERRDGRVRGVYPWGKAWPPPADAGNFADPATTARGKKPARRRTLAGEVFTQTAPVGGFAPGPHGIYDLAGNVWEWCGDAYKPHGALRQWGVLRGGSWADYGSSILLSSYRNVVPAEERDVIYGFRCVLALGEE